MTIIRRSLAPVFDRLIAEHKVKNDAALARQMGLTAVDVSKARNFKTPVGGKIILAIHETYGLPIADIKAAILTEEMP